MFCKSKKKKSGMQGTASRPRLSVFKSNTCMYCQLVDDSSLMNKVLLSFSTKKINSNKKNFNIASAKELGEVVGEKINKMGINAILFDRSGYVYHGRIAALAEGIKSKNVKI